MVMIYELLNNVGILPSGLLADEMMTLDGNIKKMKKSNKNRTASINLNE